MNKSIYKKNFGNYYTNFNLGEILIGRIVISEILNDQRYEETCQKIWQILSFYYKNLCYEIRKANKEEFGFASKGTIRSIQKKYLKETLKDCKKLDATFAELIAYLDNLIYNKCQISRKIKVEYYMSFGHSTVPSIGFIDNKIIIMINRNIDILFNKNINAFSAIFYHEVAHLIQNDTVYFFKKVYFLSSSFFMRGVVLFIERTWWIALLFTGIFIFMHINFNMDFSSPNYNLGDRMFKIFARNLILPLFLIIFSVLAYQISIRKEKRLLVEYGADVFSLVKSKNTAIIDVLEKIPSDNSDEHSEIHLSNEERVNHLKDLLSIAYLILEKRGDAEDVNLLDIFRKQN